MKALKKTLAVIMCVCLLATTVLFGMNVFAANQTGNIVIQSTADVSVNGRDFVLYKIFNAETSTSADGKKIVSYQWDDTTKDLYEEFFFGDGTEAGEIAGKTSGTIHDVADYIRTFDGKASEFSQFAARLYKFIDANPTLKATGLNKKATSDTFVIENLPLGYYMIFDNTDLTAVGTTHKVRSAVMLETAGTTTPITIKADLPTINKQVMGNDGVLQKGTSGNIGDCVKFVITTHVPDHELYTTKYDFIIEDTLPEGIIYHDDGADHKFVLKVNDVVTTENFTKTVENNKITVKIDAKKLKKDDVITIEYHAEITDAATAANKNTAKLTYSADPVNTDVVGTDESSAYVYLYHVVFTKYAENTNGQITATRLGGAQFNLYRKTDSGSELMHFTKKDATNANGQTYSVYFVAPQEIPGVTTTVLETVNDQTYGASNVINGGGFGDLLIFGLSEDDYELDEIKAPEGYVLPNYRFQISVYDEIGPTSGALTKLELQTTTTGGDNETGGKIVNAGFQLDKYAIYASVTNATGSALPGTGGIGTTLFTVFGIILMAGALAFFTSRKRSSVA